MLIVFFYVDDIVFCYRKKDQEVIEATKRGLEAKYQLNFLGEPKWFLGPHVLRDRQIKKTLTFFESWKSFAQSNQEVRWV